MPDLRSLNFSIKHEIKDKNLEKANKSVNKYQKAIVGSDKRMTQLGNTSKKSGNIIVRVGMNASKSFKTAAKSSVVLAKKIRDIAKRSKKTSEDSKKSFLGLNSALKKIGGALAGYFVFSSIKTQISEFVAGANKQIQVEKKLGAIFAATGKANEKQIDSLKKHASALQNVGVIGDEVTIAGQSQLATFNLTAKSVKTLTAGMLDLAANNKGVNATQEDLFNIANMIGKVIGSGQVGALSRVGITFTKTQEKVLKFGTEEQKAAVLAKVLEQNVGGVNKALRDTDEGKITSFANAWGDMKEVIGTTLLPVLGQLASYMETKIPMIQENLNSLVTNGINLVEVGFKNFNTAITFAKENSDILIPVLAGLAGGFAALQIIGVVSAAVGVYESVMASATVVTLLAEGPIAAVNALLLANPFGIAAVAIGGLVAAGVALYKNWDLVLAKGRELKQNIGDFFGGRASADTESFQLARGGGSSPKKTTRDGHQTGTMSASPGIFNINENRSSQGNGEMIEFKGGERVYPAATSRRMNNGGNNISPTINISINSNGDGGDLSNQIVQSIDQYFRNMATAEGMVL